MSRPDDPPKPTEDQIIETTADQRSTMLMHLIGWMGDDPKFAVGLAYAYRFAMKDRPGADPT